MSKLTLSDLQKLAIIQDYGDKDLGIPDKRIAYRKMLRQMVWQSIWSDDEKRSA